MKKSIAAVILAVLLQFFFCSSSKGCDADSFVYEEFSQRCLLIAQCIKQLQLAQLMNLPDRNKHQRKLLNEWTSFFLDHGASPPAGFAHIATATWKRTFNEAGQQIGGLTYGRMPPEKADSAMIPFYLLSQPKKFELGRQALATWSQILEKPVSDSIASESIWIGKNLESLNRVSSLVVSGSEPENLRINMLMQDIQREWQPVLSADKETAATLLSLSGNEIRAKLKKEFERWRKLFFM